MTFNRLKYYKTKPENSQIVYAIIPGALIIEPEIYTNGVSILGFMSVLCLTVAILTPIGNLSLIVAKKAVNYFLPPKLVVVPPLNEEPINVFNLQEAAKAIPSKVPEDPFSLSDFIVLHPFLSLMFLGICCLGTILAGILINMVLVITYKLLTLLRNL